MIKGIFICLGVFAGIVILGIAVIMVMPAKKQFKYPVNKDNFMLLDHSVEITTSPEKIWNFFNNIEENYKMWHPDDHILFKWKSGKPFEKGSTLYSEQYMSGEIARYNGVIEEAVPNKKIVIRFSFPVSIFSPKIEWIINEKEGHTIFTAITYMKMNKLYRTLLSRQIDKLIEDHDRHVAAEGENLKRILEAKETEE